MQKLSEPEQLALTIFEKSLASLMAHTIRGVTNYFLSNNVELDLRIIADKHQTICTGGATTLLSSRFTPKGRSGMDRVSASIFIHPHANKHLARVCIAHEIYHLLLELKAFLSNGRTQWVQIPTNKVVEDECNLFAWRLCYYHDKFNRDDEQREKHIHFPKELFDKALNTNNVQNLETWAKGIALDPNNPFYTPELPEWLKKEKSEQ